MRWRRLWAAVLALSTTAGCNALLDNKLYDLGDASADRDATTRAPGPDAAMPEDASDDATIATAESGTDAGEGEGGDGGDGGCTSLADIHTCGSCTTDCARLPGVSATGLGCANGSCTYSCASGYADCTDAGSGCATMLTSPSNCGGCGMTCSGATSVCVQSDGGTQSCASGCPAGQTNCSGTCAILTTDSNHCGTCGTACPTAQMCQSGACACPTAANPDLCGTVCTNTLTDTGHCGSCGMACTVGGQQCVGGACACPGSEINCGGTCTSPNSCGGCGTLNPAPGGPCGTCGTYVCGASKTSVTCNDPGTTNSCPTWCSSQPAPSGVLASDYQCVDFDNGLPGASTWPQTVSGSGALARSTAAADSAPDSLAVSVTGSSDVATLSWNDVGSTPVKSYSAIFGINPMTNFVHASGGNIELACINTGSNSTCLYSTNNGTDANGNTGFTGISAFSDYNGGEVAQGPCELSVTSLNPNVWNTVEIDMTVGTASGGTTTGQGQILINGTVANSSCVGVFMNSTTVNFVLGPEATDATFGWSGYIDNIRVSVKR